MNKPVVSIIIATYNSEATLESALNSVLQQDFQNWECIVVDGASKDGTVKIIDSFEKRDSRFRHISEPDRGIYDAFNKGWKLAQGEWVHYLGSDDKLTKESFCEMLAYDNTPYAVISGSAYIEKIDGSIKIQKSRGWIGCHQAKLTRKSVIEKLNGFDEKYRILADADLYFRIQNTGAQIKNYDGVVAYFASDGFSQSFKFFWKKYKESCLINKNNGHPMTLGYRSRYLANALASYAYRFVLRTFHFPKRRS